MCFSTERKPSFHTVTPNSQNQNNLKHKHNVTVAPTSDQPVFVTCARGADDAVVDVRAAVDGDLQTVVGVVVLRRLIVRIKLRKEEQQRSDGG